MELDAITPELLERALRNWQQVEDPPGELLDLHILATPHSTSPAEQFIHLYDIVRSITINALNSCRRTVGLAYAGQALTTREDMIAILVADFAQVPKHKRLEAWSALYYQYIETSLDLDVKDLVKAANVETKLFRRRVELGLKLLVEVLRRQELEAHRQLQSLQLRYHLPQPEYTRLFGTSTIVSRLVSLLTDPYGPRIVAIEGLGGIGKTALSQAVANAMADKGTLTDIIWISARQEWINAKGELEQVSDPAQSLDDILTRLVRKLGHERLVGADVAEKLKALKSLLAVGPFLVIIDNLETVADISALVPAVQSLAGDTRFLLNSRETLQHFPYVHSLQVPELTLSDSQSLIENELSRRKRKDALSAIETENIYRTVGGVPLALKLIAAQIGKFPLEYILTGLRTNGQLLPDTMFTYIYRRTWQLLDDLARQLLISMVDASPEGEDMFWLQKMSELDNMQFTAALGQLIDCSLLEVSGALREPRYRLHRLTTTFLHSDILVNWD